MARLDNELADLDTNIDTMFTPVIDTFEYKDMIIKIKDLMQEYINTTTYCPSKRSCISTEQFKENSRVSNEIRGTTNMTLKTQKLSSTNPTHDHSNNIPSQD